MQPRLIKSAVWQLFPWEAALGRKFSVRHLWAWRSDWDLIHLCQTHWPLPSQVLFACTQEPNLHLKKSSRGSSTLVPALRPPAERTKKSGEHTGIQQLAEAMGDQGPGLLPGWPAGSISQKVRSKELGEREARKG